MFCQKLHEVSSIACYCLLFALVRCVSCSRHSVVYRATRGQFFGTPGQECKSRTVPDDPGRLAAVHLASIISHTPVHTALGKVLCACTNGVMKDQ